MLLSLPVVREDTASSKAPASHLACPSMKCALTKEGSSSRARPQSATTSLHCFSLQWHRALLLYSTAWDGLAVCHVRRSSHHTRDTMFLLKLYTMFASLASQGRAERMPIARLNIDRILTIACEYTSSAASTLPWEYNLFPCSFNCLAAILLEKREIPSRWLPLRMPKESLFYRSCRKKASFDYHINFIEYVTYACMT